jgi:hypothetical protein
MSRIEPGSPVVAVLHSPREKCWGVLDEIGSAGIAMRSIDLNSFDDFIHAVAHGEQFIGPVSQFFPMWRVERLSLDEEVGELQSLAQQFEQRTGRKIFEF